MSDLFAFSVLAICQFSVLGILHDDLQLFLEANLPKPGKKKKLTLGIADMKIGAAISDFMHISCQTGGAVPEITRGKCSFGYVVGSVFWMLWNLSNTL